MACYRIYLRGIDDQIISHGDTDCATDHEACIVAASLTSQGSKRRSGMAPGVCI